MEVKAITRLAAGALALVTLAACASERGAAPEATTAAGQPSAAASQETFGTLQSPCGPGTAKGATDQGVTDTGITIGFGDDRGFPKAPGLSKEMGDAVGAMIKWCNGQGGINGRKITGNQYDAAYMQAATVMQKACKQDFMLVGHGFALDEAAEQYRVGCKLPMVAGYTVGPNAAMGPMKFEPVPYPVDHFNAAPLRVAAKTFPGFASDVDLITSTSPAVMAGSKKIEAAMKSIGVTPKKCGVQLNNEGDPSYVPFAEKFKSCGVKALWTSKSPDPAAFSLLEALDRVGADPTLVFEATWYSQAVAKWNAAGQGDNLHAGLIFQPFENAGQVPAVKKYLDLVNAESGKTALLGMQATSAFLLWATAAKDCGSDLTRQCMVNKLSQVHEWTGGGLHAPTDPGGNLPASCSLMVKLTGSTYKQVAPATVGEFDCDPANVIKTDPSTWGTKLGEDRIATTFLTPDVIKPQG
ncbi:ABC transporter substrate-binding protein [Nonomuraea cavernae]|uniref:Branched-chain amino acid ABC transporter substrate-binding protein n=1 Tax=Nonomuraea cavernae TaxID=2045107 RepID=A0A918DM89_9ACTN|nr:ABC transporter substrate-binding protein [Nonomuraea cavernae]MCA2188088.1 ABC transporter substrate-binding protein [Nonomuraea cavernae]GGO72749.1 branched-chain amino acid ABC transporter substrate-binding protein [Nonomuraea cavernae]